MIKGVIFDLGSTLIRFDAEWPKVLDEGLKALVDALLQEGFVLDGEAFAAAFRQETEGYQRSRQLDYIERTTTSVVQQAMAQFGYPSVSADVLRRAVERMYAVSEAHWQPMPGAREVLAQLRERGMLLGLISNASDEGNAQRLIDKAQLRHWFDPILISAAVGTRKPDAGLFRTVLRAWKLPAREVVMVGDTLGEDILGAQEVGMHSIWLTAEADTPGNRVNAATIRPEVIAESLYQIPALVQSLDGSHPAGAGKGRRVRGQ